MSSACISWMKCLNLESLAVNTRYGQQFNDYNIYRNVFVARNVQWIHRTPNHGKYRTKIPKWKKWSVIGVKCTLHTWGNILYIVYRIDAILLLSLVISHVCLLYALNCWPTTFYTRLLRKTVHNSDVLQKTQKQTRKKEQKKKMMIVLDRWKYNNEKKNIHSQSMRCQNKVPERSWNVWMVDNSCFYFPFRWKTAKKNGKFLMNMKLRRYLFTRYRFRFKIHSRISFAFYQNTYMYL